MIPIKGSVYPILALILWSSTGIAGICQSVEPNEEFRGSHRENSEFFDEYFVRDDDGTYRILAILKLRASMEQVVAIMNDLESFDEFMPGYRRIRVIRDEHGAIYTAIRFRPDFSFFESRFTNEVEVQHRSQDYRQCWSQLSDGDSRVVEEHAKAPKVNQGYWRVTPISAKQIELRYFSTIKPPIALPAFISEYVLKVSYREVFESIVGRLGGSEIIAIDKTGDKEEMSNRDK